MGKLKNGFKKIISFFVTIAVIGIVFFAFDTIIGNVASFLGDFLNGNAQKKVLKEVPEEFRQNYFFKAYGLGECESLTGDVCVTLVFVDDDLSKWTPKETSEFKVEVQKILTQIKNDSKRFDVDLNLTVRYKTAKSSGELSLNEYMPWVNRAISSAGLPAYSKMGEKLEEEYGVDNAPVIFCVNRDGRCFAKPSSSKRKGEFAVLYEDTDSFYHEFCHIFGAVDFYYPEEVKTLAQKNLPESIMSSNGEKVDDLTAYLIGWTKNLSEGATAFLKGTNTLTKSYMDGQHADETYTGYVSNKVIGDTTYTGYLVDGLLDGKGKKECDGNVWEGTFENGLLNGQGSFVSAKGDSYEGKFLNGKFHGKGTYTWANGTVYTGDFVGGKRTGTGSCKWSNGDTYTGDFVDGVRSGKGTYNWANGDTYTGDFVEGKLNGYGTLTYANSKVRSGQWSNGKFLG